MQRRTESTTREYELALPRDAVQVTQDHVAWRASGTRCGRLIFMVAVGTTQMALSKSMLAPRSGWSDRVRLVP